MSPTKRQSSKPRTEDQTELVGVFATLVAEHREAATLLAALMADARDAPALWPRIRAALVSHEQGEVRELFPVLRGDAGLPELANHHDDDARTLDSLISQLDAQPMTSALWMTTFATLVATVTEHVAEEEGEIFPAAQQALGAKRALEIDLKYTETKAKLVDGHWAPPREPNGLMQTTTKPAFASEPAETERRQS